MDSADEEPTVLAGMMQITRRRTVERLV